MDHLERVKRCIAGERLDPSALQHVDAFSFKDRNPVALADASLHLRDEYEMDFLKLRRPGCILCRILAQHPIRQKRVGTPSYAEQSVTDRKGPT